MDKILLTIGIIAGTINTSSAFSFSPTSSTHSFAGHRNTAFKNNEIQSAVYHVPGRKSRHTLRMGWGPDPIWEDATIISNEETCTSCVVVILKVNPETVQGFKTPGQYCQVKFSTNENDKPIFLAVASPPPKPTDDDDSQTQFEFLIKKTENNGWITEAEPGAVLQCSQVMGGGFSIEDSFEGLQYDFPTQNVLMFAAGSGIAPIRSAIESGMLNITPPGEGGRTARLYYGARTIDDMPFIERMAKWEMAGVEVVPVLSDPHDSYQGRTGYVQTALEEDGVPIPRNSGALMCGMKGMTEAVKSILGQAGVFEGRILTNF